MRGLYIHIPFCQHKCSYCDFYAVERLEMVELFVEALCREVALLPENFPEAVQEPIGTLYFGGGTPSLLAPHQLERILAALQRVFRFESKLEWTLECNPGTVDRQRLQAYRAVGVNRISFGVQSLADDELRFLERLHSAEDACQAVEWAFQAGFDNVNVDLMFALPGQTLLSWQRTLERVRALAPQHISAYSLIWEPGTPLYRRWQQGQIAPVSEELESAQYELAASLLEQDGYVHYEVSNFAQPGYVCRHNLLYWHGEQYVALGPAAHGYVNGRRYWNVRNLRRYLELLRQGKLPIAGSEQLSAYQRLEEVLFLGLRSDGLRFESIRREFGLELEREAQELFQRWDEAGLLRLWTPERLWLNSRGYALCDELAAELVVFAERLWKRRYGTDSMPGVLPLRVLDEEAVLGALPGYAQAVDSSSSCTRMPSLPRGGHK
ncbi:Oxygen-independent coproporphyrinogen-III oxidase-like protein YqeR [bacterium HR21]|nr:Oxygen-independent coproporphyrinogen-III oxidase-like protein YqeR [bacterium HR21]